MSITVLQIIPADPLFVPAVEDQKQAELHLSTLFSDSQVKTGITEDVEFIDQGSNWEGLYCNKCGQPITTEAWNKAMDHANEIQFSNLEFLTECCKQHTSLNDLDYTPEAGFAKFTLSVIDPKAEFAEEALHELQLILKVPLKEVWVRY